MKKALLIIGILFLTIGLVHAVSQEELNEAKTLIDSKIACNTLTNDQLEIIGEYYMEQMMPGEGHKRAHEMMGLTEGSDAEEQFHIQMAKRSYCGENTGMMGGNVMGGGMIGNYSPSYANNGYWNIAWILIFAAVIFLIVWLVYQFGMFGTKKTASETPLTILRKRYAEGEITKKDFEDMKKEIEG